MSKRNIPFFEVNGKKYEIKRNRYLQAEFDELKSKIQMSDVEQIVYAKEQELLDRIEKLKKRKEELYDKYLETFNEDDEQIYKKACKAFEDIIEESGRAESVTAKQRQKTIDIGEELIIKALQIDNNGNTVYNEDEAKEIWQSFVDDNGEVVAVQFIIFTINYILGNDEDIENPFLTQAKAKAEQKASMRKGIVTAK